MQVQTTEIVGGVQPVERSPIIGMPRTALADYPLKEWVNWTFGTWSNWERACHQVQNRVNWNRDCIIGFEPSCVRYDLVEKVMECYVNNVLSDEIPEYEPIWNAERNTYQMKKIILTKVALCADAAESDVMEILWELYWGTQDNSVTSQYALHPKASKEQQIKYQHIPEGADSPTNTFNAIFDVFKWIAIIAVVGGVGYVGYEIYLAQKALR